MRKKAVIYGIFLVLALFLCACGTGKTDDIMVELKELGYVSVYGEGEKVVKYDGVVPSKQVYYEYPMSGNEANHVYRIYFEEEDVNCFKLYDYAGRVWYRFELDEDELTELERQEF